MAVHSVPTGMMVNVDNEWVGITPCVIMLPDDGEGGFKGPLLTVIEAVPVTGGLQSTKMWWPKQRIPSRVVFTLPWAPRQPAKQDRGLRHHQHQRAVLHRARPAQV